MWAAFVIVAALVIFAAVGIVSGPSLAPGIALVLAALVLGWIILRRK